MHRQFRYGTTSGQGGKAGVGAHGAYQSVVAYSSPGKGGDKVVSKNQKTGARAFQRRGEVNGYLKNIVKRFEEEKLPIHVLWWCGSVTEKETTRYQTSGFKYMIIWVLVSCCSSFSQDSV